MDELVLRAVVPALRPALREHDYVVVRPYTEHQIRLVRDLSIAECTRLPELVRQGVLTSSDPRALSELERLFEERPSSPVRPRCGRRRSLPQTG